jgi:hypothetical protein
MDNMQKNIFYLLRKTENGYRMYLLPWDTDMSWGTVWRDEAGGFVYDFEASRQNVTLRQEYEWMQTFHPNLDQQMAKRWQELRKDLLTMENVTATIGELAISDLQAAVNGLKTLETGSSNQNPTDDNSSNNGENSADNSEEESGCGSVVGGLTASLVGVAAAALAVKKKKED